MTTTRHQVTAIGERMSKELRELVAKVDELDDATAAGEARRIEASGVWDAIYALADAIDDRNGDTSTSTMFHGLG